jgi:ADP-heptose:LPS heptosyltransferase
VLIVRPDTYGDLVLFEPALRLLRERWPDSRIALLARAPYADIAPLFAFAIEWLTTTVHPYREGFATVGDELSRLRTEVRAFDPDCVVAACYNKTWLEAVVASWAPDARRISLGPATVDPLASILIARETGQETAAWFPEIVDVDADSHERDKNLRLASHLLGEPAPPLRPALQIPQAAHDEATQWIAAQGLSLRGFLVCCPGGGANVAIKAWPGERYASVLSTAANELGLAAVVAGHASEAEVLDAVADLVERQTGSRPPVWLGRDGGFAETAALVEASRAYIGNDTGLAHVAAALDRPSLVVYGGGTWPRFLPTGRRSLAVALPLACFGCGWDCLFDEPLCLTRLSTEAVVGGLRRLVGPDPIDGAEVLADAPLPDAEQTRIAAAVAAAGAPPGRSVVVPRRDLERLLDQLHFAEQDRAARLAVIESQGAELTRRAGADGEQVAALEARLSASEADRAARLQVITQQGGELGRIPALEADIAYLKAQIESIDADRVARLAVIEQQGRELGRIGGLEADIAFLKGQVAALDAERTALADDRLAMAAIADQQARELAGVRSDAAGLRVRIELARQSRLYRLLRRLGLLGALEGASGPSGARS